MADALQISTVDSFFQQQQNQTDDRLTNYVRLLLVEIEATGTDANGDPTARPSTPADDPAIQRPFYPLIGSATVGDWKWALTTGNGMIILGEATGGGGGPNPLPVGGSTESALRKNSATDYDVKWVVENYPENNFNGSTALSSYSMGATTMPVSTASTGWPVASTAWNILTVKTDSDSGFQLASREDTLSIQFRRHNPGAGWQAWRDFAYYDGNGYVTPTGIVVAEQASIPAITVNQSALTVMDKSGRSEWFVKDSTGEVSVLMQDSWFVAQNKAPVTVNRGTIMKLDASLSTDPDTPSVVRCDAVYSSTTGMPAIGFLMDSGIAQNGFGRIMTSGILTNVNTSAYSVGDDLYVGVGVGTLTNVKPVSPHRAQKVGKVLTVNASTGAILVTIEPIAKTGDSASNITWATGDTVNSNATANTLADIPGMSFPMITPVEYTFKAKIVYDAAATTTGARFVVNGPTMSRIAYYTTLPSVTAGGTTPTTTHYNALNLPSAASAGSPFTTNNICIIEGIALSTVDGTLQIRFASEVASSAITIRMGSLEWST